MSCPLTLTGRTFGMVLLPLASSGGATACSFALSIRSIVKVSFEVRFASSVAEDCRRMRLPAEVGARAACMPVYLVPEKMPLLLATVLPQTWLKKATDMRLAHQSLRP